MRCIGCPAMAEGYSVIPGIGEAGEIRFYCDVCARKDRVKMRYWDGRDLDVGGYRERPDLGASFQALVLSFQDAGRMRREDLKPLMEWLEDPELALALRGTDAGLVRKICSVLPPGRVRRVRELLDAKDPKGTAAAPTSEAARELFVSLVQRL